MWKRRGNKGDNRMKQSKGSEMEETKERKKEDKQVQKHRD